MKNKLLAIAFFIAAPIAAGLVVTAFLYAFGIMP